MKTSQRVSLLLLIAVLAPPAAAEVAAQERVPAAAGQHYAADGMVRALAGSNWRDVWTARITVPVLDLATYGGGLKAEETGGRQSRTLHFQGGDGRRYIFRSVDKFLHEEALPVALRWTPVGDVVQDQISSLFPAAGLLVGPMYEAAGLLHPWPTLVVMPNDPRLGEFREEYAGMLGQIEENPQEGPDDTPGFAGSSKLNGVDNFLEKLDESSKHRVNASEYLAARLIQFMIGDTDRGGDQWRFAEFPDPDGTGSIWRPVARDHDFAFMRNGGLLGVVSNAVYPKLAKFDGTFESLRTLTFMTYDMDRRLLVGLPRERWDSVVAAVQRSMTDEVLNEVVARIPPEWQAVAAPRILPGLQSRRDDLRSIASEFYAMVSGEADVHATAEAESAEVERLSDGSVEVRLYAARSPAVASASQPAPPAPGARRVRMAVESAPFFQRRFLADETDEIRLYMAGGDDEVTVSGAAPNSIRVRVIGGGGDDLLVDSSDVETGGAATVFYTAHGDDEVVRGESTRVNDGEFDARLPGRPHDLQALAPDPDAPVSDDEEEPEDEQNENRGLQEDVTKRLTGAAYRDWGTRSGFAPVADFRSGVGLVIGAGPSYTRYGFRREPHKYSMSANALYALDGGRFGVEAEGDYRFENSSLGLSLDASATQFETFRFFGYGNDAERPDGISARVYRDQVTVQPALFWEQAGTYIGAGPIFRYGKPEFEDGSPMAVFQPFGSEAFSQAGAAAQLRIERGTRSARDPRAFSLEIEGSAYPALLDVSEPFQTGRALARAWLPLGWPFLALRAGGERAWGTFPVHEAVFLGGRNSLRGFETDRFAGDASLFGSAELHAPLGTIELLVRGETGIFGMADAGRVYFDGASPGGWHTSYGGGVWFASLDHTLSLTYATGEIGRFYLRLGMPF